MTHSHTKHHQAVEETDQRAKNPKGLTSMTDHTSKQRKRRAPPKRHSSSYPPQYQKLLLHVANTGEEIVVNNLNSNSRAVYTTFRARVNEFRRAFYDEAIAENNKTKMQMAELMYAVTLRDPRQENGKWQITVSPREASHADAIDDLLPNKFQIKLPTTPVRVETEREAEELVSRLYGSDDDEETHT